MHIRYAFSMCAIACLLSASSAASADDAMTDTARELFAKGFKAAEQHRWDQCRAALLAAFAIRPHPQVAGNLAACELKLGLHRDAAEHIAYFLRELKPDAPREKRMYAEAGMREAQAKIEAVQVTVNVNGAEVRLDGKVVGRSPLLDPVFVMPGPHTFDAIADGFPIASASIDAKAAGMRDLALVLKRAEPPPPPVVVVPPEARPVWPAVVTGALAVGGLAVGAGLTVAANGKGTDVGMLGTQVGGRSACFAKAPGCDALRDAAASRDMLSSVGLWSFVAGGAFALTAAGLGMWAGMAPTKAAVHVVPLVGAGQAGVGMVGSW
jgi:hypothetical protein